MTDDGRLMNAMDALVDSLRRLAGLTPRPPKVIELKFDAPLVMQLPATLFLRTRRAVHAHLHVTQGEEVLFDGAVPPNSQICLTPVTRERVRLRLVLESRSAGIARNSQPVLETFVELSAPPPTRIDAPNQAKLGDGIPVNWEAPGAVQVKVIVTEDNYVSESLGPPVGALTLRPCRPGRLMLRIVAEYDSDKSRTDTCFIEVVATPLRINLLSPPIQYGLLGEQICFDWAIEGARTASLVALTRGERQEVELNASMLVTLQTEPEDFLLLALPFDGGRPQRVRLRADPRPLRSLNRA